MIYLLKDLTYVGQRGTESRIRQIHKPISELKRNIPMFRSALHIMAAISTEARFSLEITHPVSSECCTQRGRDWHIMQHAQNKLEIRVYTKYRSKTLKGRGHFGDTGLSWWILFKRTLKGTRSDVINWFNLTQVKYRQRIPVKSITYRVSLQAKYFLTSSAATDVPRKTSFFRVC